LGAVVIRGCGIGDGATSVGAAFGETFFFVGFTVSRASDGVFATAFSRFLFFPPDIAATMISSKPAPAAPPPAYSAIGMDGIKPVCGSLATTYSVRNSRA
jgi:hypothetical protein